MKVEYRGFHLCEVEAAEPPTIELVEVSTGMRLPTKIVGGPEESLGELTARARRLCDMYAGRRAEVRTVWPAPLA